MNAIAKPLRSRPRTILGILMVALALVVLNVYLWIIATHVGTGAGGPFAFRWVRGLSGWAFERAFQDSDFIFFHAVALLAIWALVYGLVLAIRGRKKVKHEDGAKIAKQQDTCSPQATALVFLVLLWGAACGKVSSTEVSHGPAVYGEDASLAEESPAL